MAAAPGSDGFLGKEESSFSEEKEAKRLSFICAGGCFERAQRMKVFWFFFSKKNFFLS
jgi:hypothetical protein